MLKTIYFSILFLLLSNVTFSQSIDDALSQKKMRKDLTIFKNIRTQANSGLYKYRTKKQIDSLYNWAEKQIEHSYTYIDFYNIISQLTDFEGSLHNYTQLSKKILQNLKKEEKGYFPYPIKWIEGKWIVNIEHQEIPLGAEIVSINGEDCESIMKQLYKYYTTDGYNLTGKRIGLQTHFSKYYRFNFGLQESFTVKYKVSGSEIEQTKIIKSCSNSEYYKNFRNRFSKPFDQKYYDDLDENEKYSFKKLDDQTGVLTIHTFAMGDEKSEEHKNYKTFLERTFLEIKELEIKNLIMDVRLNGGGTDPNDIVTYSFLTNRAFQENKQAWISFKKIPFLRYYDSKTPRFLRGFFVSDFNEELQEIFPEENDGNYYQNANSDDHKVRTPDMNAFDGKVYLLISPAVASAGSLFASMVAGNATTTTIGEETMGGYYGHNGHTPLEYKLPNSKITFQFSIVNLEQDVLQKANQKEGRGIIPDVEIQQTYTDYLEHKDTQFNYTLELIKAQNLH